VLLSSSRAITIEGNKYILTFQNNEIQSDIGRESKGVKAFLIKIIMEHGISEKILMD